MALLIVARVRPPLAVHTALTPLDRPTGPAQPKPPAPPDKLTRPANPAPTPLQPRSNPPLQPRSNPAPPPDRLADCKADVWSMGVVFYEMFNGKLLEEVKDKHAFALLEKVRARLLY